MRFLLDAQLPPALVRHLKALGHQAEHVFDIGLVGASDAEIWARASADRAVILSKDDDFADRARDPAAKGQVVWIRLGNVTNASLWRNLEPQLAEIVEALEAGETLIEIV